MVTATELRSDSSETGFPPVTQTHDERFPKPEEVRGPNLLSFRSKVIDEDAEIPDGLNVRAIRSGRFRLRRGDKLPKPADRVHYRLKDAIRQLTPDEKGVKISGRDESGGRIKPIRIFVNHEGGRKGDHKIVYSIMGDLEARPQSRTQRRRRQGHR